LLLGVHFQIGKGRECVGRGAEGETRKGGWSCWRSERLKVGSDGFRRRKVVPREGMGFGFARGQDDIGQDGIFDLMRGELGSGEKDRGRRTVFDLARDELGRGEDYVGERWIEGWLRKRCF
jgi:hypothetical protein